MIEEKDKYYTPEIEDLHVGYECELSMQSSTGVMMLDFSGESHSEFIPFPEPFRYWSKVPIIEKESLYIGGREIQLFIEALKDKRVRTKYLDKEDIEALGWNLDHAVEEFIKFQKKTDNSLFLLEFYKNSQHIAIDQLFRNINLHIVQIFKGECKSINELRKIMKMLKIEV